MHTSHMAGRCLQRFAGTLAVAAFALAALSCESGGDPQLPPRSAADVLPSAWAQPGGDPRNSRVSAYTGPASIASRGSLSTGGTAQQFASVVFSMDSAAYFSTGALYAVDRQLTALWIYAPDGTVNGQLCIDSSGDVLASVGLSNANPDLIPSDTTMLLRLSSDGAVEQETDIGRLTSMLFGPDGTVYSRVTDAHGESHALEAWSAAGEELWRQDVGNRTRTLPEMALASIDGAEWIFADLETRVRADGSQTAPIGDSAWSGLALDPQGNAYLESDGNVNFRKLSPAGEVLWEYPEGNFDPTFSPAAVTADGRVALQVYGDKALAVLLDSDGSVFWERELPEPADPPLVFFPDVLLDAAGNCYFTYGSTLLAFSPAGDELWRETIEDDSFAGQISIAPGGNLYVLTRSGVLRVYSADPAAFPAS